MLLIDLPGLSLEALDLSSLFIAVEQHPSLDDPNRLRY